MSRRYASYDVEDSRAPSRRAFGAILREASSEETRDEEEIEEEPKRGGTRVSSVRASSATHDAYAV